MTNIVDTSEETVNAEFDAAEKEIGPEENQTENEESPDMAAIEEAQKEAEIAAATGLIATSLKFAVGSFVGVKVDENLYQQTAESYAVCIIKYFPGGLFALLDKFKEELAAATATFVLIKAVSEAKAKQQEEMEKAKAEENKKPFSPENESKQETANGDS